MKAFAAILVSLALLTPSAMAGELLPAEEPFTAPDLSLPDLGGRPHNLASYRGEVVLVNFWASWCPPCLMEMPSMQRLATALEDRPFRLLAVNVRESRSKAWKFMKLLNVTFTALLDSKGEAAETWDVQIYPTSYLIDAEGRVRYVAYGPVEWDAADIIQTIEALLPARKAAQQATLE